MLMNKDIMMKKISIILIAVIASAIGCKRNKIQTSSLKCDKIWLDQTKVNPVIDYEKSMTGTEFLQMNVSLSKSVFPLLDNYKIAKPIIVKHAQTGFLPLNSHYFFS
mgnify:CR=1 FL=1